MRVEDFDEQDIAFAWSLEHESDHIEDYSNWLELLSQPASKRGLLRVTVARFARRGGYKVFAEVGVGPANATPAAATTVEFDAHRLAKEAHAHAARDHRRTAAGMYRLQLWHAAVKKDEQDRAGDYATIKFDAAADASPEDNPKIFESHVLKVVRLMLNDARQHNEALTRTHCQVVQAASGTALLGMQLVEEMSRKQLQLSNAASALQRAPTAADINARVKTVADKLEDPMRIIASAVADKIRTQAYTSAQGPARPPHAPAGAAPTGPQTPHAAGAPPAPPPSAPQPLDQQTVQAFFDELTGEQKDQLRDALGEQVFAALVEVIMGAPEQWAIEAGDFKKLLMDNAAQLQSILTPEQLAKVLSFL